VKAFSNSHAGYAADMALSPAGDRLYISSQRLNPGVGGLMDTYDTFSGSRVAETANHDLILKQQPPVYRSRIAMSASGKYICILRMQDAGQLYVTAFDTTDGTFLPLHVPLAWCSDPVLLPTDQDLNFDVMCSGWLSLLEITATDSVSAGSIRSIPIVGYNPQKNGSWAAAFPISDKRKVALVANDGSLFAPSGLLSGVQLFRHTPGQAFVLPE
jgi:hypothetical protein